MTKKLRVPTRTKCVVCEKLMKNEETPVINTLDGRASSADLFPIHNWYNFVLGYTPEFPEYLFEKFGVGKNDIILDPFMGAGTTLVCAKKYGVTSVGIDANDFMAHAVSTKLNWTRDTKKLKEIANLIFPLIREEFSFISWYNTDSDQIDLFSESEKDKLSFEDYAAKHRPEMLTKRYMSDKPFVKAHIIKSVIIKNIPKDHLDFFRLGLSSILVPISNISYGPGFGVRKPKEDVDVYEVYKEKIERMISDLEILNNEQKNTESKVVLGDSRKMSEYVEPESIDYIITSPPYPGDHEYTKHTRLELIFDDMATDLSEFRKIKKRMIRGSTTNIYKNDNDREIIAGTESIQQITDLIQKRLDEDNATSGFEKLYTKLVWEYFGGMYKSMTEAMRVLKPGGKFALLVSDTHAFKMVHIQTADILEELALQIGYSDSEIELWQNKTTTSHKYNLRESTLILTK